MNKRHTARAVVIKDGQILLFERWRTNLLGQTHHYFSIPGGGIERGEAPEDAVVREMEEEMTVTVRPVRLLARQKANSHHHSYFLCEIVSGEPRFNPASEEAIFRALHNNRYEVAWLPLNEAASKVRHDTYRQFLELLPGLLESSSRQPVDIVASGE